MNWIFIAVYIVWIASEILLNRLLRSSATDKQHADKHTLRLIWIVIIISNTLAGIVAGNVYIPIAAGNTIAYIGLAVIMLGVIIRLLVVQSLGRFFTVDVTIRQNHRLKKDGFYRYLRHPSYFASLLSFTGFGLTFNNWLSLALTTIPVLLVFLQRIRVEEKLLLSYFGEEYAEYKKHTNAIIPFIY